MTRSILLASIAFFPALASAACPTTVGETAFRNCMNAQLTALQTENEALREALGDLLELAEMIEVDGEEGILSGANLHLRAGGSSTSDMDGTGNLIIGFGEEMLLDGSHNVIIGGGHHVSSYAGLVGGAYNALSAPGTSILGGIGNHADVSGAVIWGGADQTASYEDEFCWIPDEADESGWHISKDDEI